MVASGVEPTRGGIVSTSVTGIMMVATGMATAATVVTGRFPRRAEGAVAGTIGNDDLSISNNVSDDLNDDISDGLSNHPSDDDTTTSYLVGRSEPRSGAARLNRSRVDALGLVSATPERVQRVARTQWAAISIVGAFVMLLAAADPTPATISAALIAAGGAWQVPLIVARRRESERTRLLDRELGDALGELVMGVEAGLTLEAVMVRYAQRRTSPLGTEFEHMTQSVQLGTTRRDALTAFTTRNPSPTVRLFSAAVEQNQTLGTPLGNVLRQQAATIRRHRRQAAETDAAKLSMKMIFPTVFCILPVLLIVVVGPAIVRLMEVL